jgi:Protein of unknown function (DUF1569)
LANISFFDNALGTLRMAGGLDRIFEGSGIRLLGMKSLYEAAVVDEVKLRLAELRPDSSALWGKMTAAQMLAHLAVNLESGLGERAVKRSLVGRLIGPLFRKQFFGDKPFPKSSPTAPEFVMADVQDLELEVERARVVGLVERFFAAGSAGCTREPHCFFGPFTPEEWGMGMYKHTDHHLRQFGV